MTDVANPTDHKLSRDLQKIAARVSKEIKKSTGRDDVGFCLVTFQTTDDSRCSYISNCSRKEVADALRFLLERWGEGMPDIPAHDIQ